ncbi:hypothetical protein E4T89_02050 [Jeotgalicoccus nanhaiensis]|uniref:Uncharacterized protein n=1 Tax=Jeotgalicoccus nanhaiensis TaxID=568603 RepID=A0ABR9XX50_9STAP|nr:hypothetical protein [Jeotgalicoccus nanhaiensis]MBF0753039.1 hypothetical protein [Jeotgalicoccus nanhaiensis]TFU63190.1 hypothetical protein E4T89_02050 [Jeotgalicoccus nanhaiensis]
MDFVNTIIIALVYVVTFKIQKVFFSNAYFSVSQLLTEFESGIRWNRIVIRVIITLLMSIIFLFIVQNPLVVIIGIGLGSVLIVWPAFLSEGNIDYALQEHKNLYRLTLLVFVVVNIIISVLSILIYELLQDIKNLTLLYSVLGQIVLALFSQWLYIYLSKKLNSRVHQRNHDFYLEDEDNEENNEGVYYEHNNYPAEEDELDKYRTNLWFNNKLNYFKNRLLTDVNFTDEEITYMYKYANEYEIDFSYINSLLTIERFNRGDFITKYKEHLSVKYLPQFTANQDPSLGVGQIKISTAEKYFPNTSKLELQQLLLNTEFNISLCANIIKDFQENPNEDNTNLGLIKLYTTGSSDSLINDTIRLYCYLFEWLINKDI